MIAENVSEYTTKENLFMIEFLQMLLEHGLGILISITVLSILLASMLVVNQ